MLMCYANCGMTFDFRRDAVRFGRRGSRSWRRQPRAVGEQLAFDDLDGWRLHAIITNIGADRLTAAEVEAHHRLRGGIPEDTIRALTRPTRLRLTSTSQNPTHHHIDRTAITHAQNPPHRPKSGPSACLTRR